MQIKQFLALTAMTTMISAAQGQIPVYQDKTKPIEERVEDANG